MDSTVMPKSPEMPRSSEADDVLTARADERLAHAYDQIARADEQLARLTEQLTRMEQDSAHSPIPLRRVPLMRQSRGRPALRGFIGLLAVAGIAGAAFVMQSSYGETVRPVIAQWVAPYLGSVSWASLAKPDVATQPAPSGVRLASAEPAPAQAAPLAQAAPQDAAPAQAAPLAQAAPQDAAPAALMSPELALLQTMARDLAAVQQGIEQLKTGQEQLVGDNAKATEQIKATQEQVTRLVARVSEQEQRAARAAVPPPPPPRPVAEPARRPAPASSQARAQPMQLQPAQR